jgi:uncharacterized membrane protein
MNIWAKSYVRSALKYLWILSVLFLISQLYASYSSLPERVATHFDASGNPNGWSSKGSFITTWSLTLLGLNALWLIITLLVPFLLVEKKIKWAVNIPNRDYWMSTDELRKICAELINALIFGMAFLTNALFAVIYYMIVQSNINPNARSSIWVVWIMVGILLIFSFVYLFTAFRKNDFVSVKEE